MFEDIGERINRKKDQTLEAAMENACQDYSDWVETKPRMNFNGIAFGKGFEAGAQWQSEQEKGETATTLLAERDALQAEVERLREALESMLGEFAPVSNNSAAVKARAALNKEGW